MGEVDMVVETKAIEKVHAKVAKGEITKLADLVSEVVKPSQPMPTKVALPVQLNDDVRGAIEKLPEVFGKVVPAEKREVTPTEVDALISERNTIDSIISILQKRKADISLIALNHSDEADGRDDGETLKDPITGDPLVNKDGHLVRKTKIYGTEDNYEVISVEGRVGSPTLDVKLLEQIANDPDNADWISHKDYLEMTTQVRVFDENKAMVHIKKNPAIIRAIRDASVPGAASVPVFKRKRK